MDHLDLVESWPAAKIMIECFHMTWTSLLQAGLATLLVLLLWLDALHLSQLYLFGFLLSAVSYTFGNAKHAIMPQLFPRERMTDIQARFSLLGTVLSIIGPSIAGFLIIWLAYEWLFFLYAISLVLLWVTVPCCLSGQGILSNDQVSQASARSRCSSARRPDSRHRH
ncbi:hypothetical protein ABU162_26525 [Paenibacillus thiaminolyticus]|uniref:hypothetical protein n=1 Tax=Paenibacillus thiaminolyticus TaxID=49283 RepID=UPI0035A57630